MGERGPRCCYTGCETTPVVLHLFVGTVRDKVREDAGYSGGSFCSWQHLRYWMAEHAYRDELGVSYLPPSVQPTGRVKPDP